MIRIKSITDVITNSSTEVFIFDTSKSLCEVAEFLEGNTQGYEGPEILTMENGGGEIMKAMLGYGYFVDAKDDRSLEQFWYVNVIDGFDYKYGYKRHNKAWEKLNLAWRDYLMENKDMINSRKDGITPIRDTDTVDSVRVYYPLLPEGFIKRFVENYRGPLPSPSCWDIPKDMIAENYVGKIGIISSGDNTIPYDTWEKINSALEGRNWHLG